MIGVSRTGRLRLGVLPNAHIQEGDVLIARGSRDDMNQLQALNVQELTETVRDKDLRTDEATLAEVVVSQKAHFIGETLRDMEFRSRYGVTVLGIWREEAPLEHIADIPLHLGDSLLVQGRRERIEALREDDSLLLLREPEEPNRRLHKAPINLLIFIVMISLVATGTIHISVVWTKLPMAHKGRGRGESPCTPRATATDGPVSAGCRRPSRFPEPRPHAPRRRPSRSGAFPWHRRRQGGPSWP